MSSSNIKSKDHYPSLFDLDIVILTLLRKTEVNFSSNLSRTIIHAKRTVMLLYTIRGSIYLL